MLSSENATMLGIKINLQNSSLIWQCKPSRDNNSGEERGPPCFQRVPIRYILYDKCVFVWCKKKNLQTLINMTVRMVCVHVCVCVRASKKERKLGTYSIWSPTYCQRTRLYTCPCFSWPSSSPLSICHHLELTPSSPSPSDAHWHPGPFHSHLKHKAHSS